MKCYKLHGLLPLFLLLFLFLCPTVKASTYPTMSTEQAEAIINYFLNSEYYTSPDNPNVKTYLQNLSADVLKNNFNNSINNFTNQNNFDITWKNISVLCFQYSSTRIELQFFISQINNQNILEYYHVAGNSGNYIQWSNGNTTNLFTAQYLIKNDGSFVNNNISFEQYNNSKLHAIKPAWGSQIIDDRLILPFYLVFSEDSLIHDYTFDRIVGLKNYIQFNNDGTIGNQSFIEDNTSGDNGYYFINDGVLTVDYNQWRTQNLKQNFFIGKNLNMVNTYYYYNESGERVNANELIYLNYLDYPASGDKTGKWYFPQTSWVRYRDYYPYNIYQALNVQFVSGDEILEEKTVVDDLLVINWSDSSISGDIIGTTTGTIINSSGDVIGNYSGDSNFGDLNQNDFQNDISNTTDEMIASISGELSNNEIIGALNNAEQGLINVFKSKPGDFIISWDNVILYDKTFIPSGEINFNAYCRDVPILGQIKTYLNIILSALFSFAIIRQVYNLLLGALGIDDPNLYEHSTDEALGRNADTSAGYTYMTRPGLARAIRHQNRISKQIYQRDLKRYREERRRRDS